VKKKHASLPLVSLCLAHHFPFSFFRKVNESAFSSQTSAECRFPPLSPRALICNEQRSFPAWPEGVQSPHQTSPSRQPTTLSVHWQTVSPAHKTLRLAVSRPSSVQSSTSEFSNSSRSVRSPSSETSSAVSASDSEESLPGFVYRREQSKCFKLSPLPEAPPVGFAAPAVVRVHRARTRHCSFSSIENRCPTQGPHSHLQGPLRSVASSFPQGLTPRRRPLLSPSPVRLQQEQQLHRHQHRQQQ
jgi:hypothetical protein